jgi:hypothetical protein
MRRFLVALGLATLGLLALPTSAQDTLDGPKVKFEDAYIENLVGEWHLMRSIRGQVVQNKVVAEWVLNHQFLQIHMTDVATPPAYEAIVLVGYSHADREYVAHWCDVFGGSYSAIGGGRLAGNNIEFAFQYPDGPFYNTFSWSPQEQAWTLRMETVDAKGARILFATDVLRRAQAPHAPAPGSRD